MNSNSKQELIGLFSNVAADYDCMGARTNYVGPNWIKQQLYQLPTLEFHRVLDLGCANGKLRSAMNQNQDFNVSIYFVNVLKNNI